MEKLMKSWYVVKKESKETILRKGCKRLFDVITEKLLPEYKGEIFNYSPMYLCFYGERKEVDFRQEDCEIENCKIVVPNLIRRLQYRIDRMGKKDEKSEKGEKSDNELRVINMIKEMYMKERKEKMDTILDAYMGVIEGYEKFYNTSYPVYIKDGFRKYIISEIERGYDQVCCKCDKLFDV